MRAASLALFAHVAGRAEEEVDLLLAATLLGEIAYGEVDAEAPRARLDALGDGAKKAIAGVVATTPRIERLLQFLYQESGFQGDREDYYDPRNSFIHEVLERRAGIPISLALVFCEVAARAGVEAHGVSFPGHFLVRSPVPGGTLVVDPFEGRLVGVSDLRKLYMNATGQKGEVPPKLIEAASKRTILLRMLANLRGIYTSRGDDARLCGVLERVQILSPSDENRREIQRLGGGEPFVNAQGPRSLN